MNTIIEHAVFVYKHACTITMMFDRITDYAQHCISLTFNLNRLFNRMV